MEYTAKNAKKWAKLGQRPVFGMAVGEMAAENKNLIALVADVMSSAGLSRLHKDLPEQVIDVGIAEQNMMGIAAGLASEGFDVITATFAPFQTMRCLEQIRVNLGYMKQKVVFVGLAAGMAYGELGFTHCSLEDVALISAIPNIAIVSPADCMEVCKTVKAAVKYNSSVYIRLMNKTNIPIVYADDYDFTIGKAIVLRKGEDVALVASGTMVYQSLVAADILAESGISATVVNMHTLKPLDADCLDKLMNHKLLVTIEEHSVIGGLGSAVAECFAAKINKPPQILIGINDEFPHAGSYEYLLRQCGLTGEQIAEQVKKYIAKL